MRKIKRWMRKSSRTVITVTLMVVAILALLYALVSSGAVWAGSLVAGAMVILCVVGLFFYTRQPVVVESNPAPIKTSISPSILVSEVRTAALVSYGQIGTVKIKKERQRATGEFSSMILNPFIGEELLMDVGVRVVAGVNLKHLQESDVRISDDGKRADITLPPTKVMMVYVDEALTQVLWHKKGWLSRQDISMLDSARREAMTAMVDSAIEKGLLERASQQAAIAVAGIARSMGVEQVNVVPTLPPVGQHFEELQDPDAIAKITALPLNPEPLPMVNAD